MCLCVCSGVRGELALGLVDSKIKMAEDGYEMGHGGGGSPV